MKSTFAPQWAPAVAEEINVFADVHKISFELKSNALQAAISAVEALLKSKQYFEFVYFINAFWKILFTF